MRPPRSRLVAPVLLGVALGCAVNPVSQHPEVVFVTEERERALGDEAAHALDEQIGVVRLPTLSPFVDALGRSVAAQAPPRNVEYRFAVLDRPEPNAFALPGGRVYVSRGLLALTNSEDELACVLAHEIVHVAARHYAQRRTRAAGIGLLTFGGTLLSAALGGALGQALAAPFDVLGSGLLAGYSREQEREADRVGQEITAASGYQPVALADFLARLEQNALLVHGASSVPSFTDTHPGTPERVADARAWAAALPVLAPEDAAGARAAYLLRLEGLLVGANPAHGLFVGPRFVHPDRGFTLRFPDDWETASESRAVGAVSPRRDGRIALEFQGEGDDPRAAGEALLASVRRQVSLDVSDSHTARVGGLPAFRARARATGPDGVVALSFTWIAHRGEIYRIVAGSPDGPEPPHAAALEDAALSFRPLRRYEREAITADYLHVANALEGESLAQLSRRTRSAWPVERTAVMNGLDPDAALSAGASVKIALSLPYRPAVSSLALGR